MFDIRLIRDNPEAFDAGLRKRGVDGAAARILEIDALRRAAQTSAQTLQGRRNKLSKEIGAAKARGEDASALIAEVSDSKDDEARAEREARSAAQELEKAISDLPNLLADEVPEGTDDDSNVEVRHWAEPPQFDFLPRDHVDIGEGLGMMDFERAAKLSGARFVVLSRALAQMERALAAFMLDMHTREFGYTEMAPPVLVRDEALFGTGQLPKFADDQFQTKKLDLEALHQHVSAELERWEKGRLASLEAAAESPTDRARLLMEHVAEVRTRQIGLMNEALESGRFEERYWLIPTAEVPLTNMVAGEILDAERLPIRLVAWTQCFRSEAGAAGKDTHGMIRQHQFSKVELVSVTRPEDSGGELDRMTSCAEEVLKRLGLPYRVVLKCAGDTGFSATKSYDIEVWLPGQNRYREISSCSNCTDFQARRMSARYRSKGEKGTRFVHTLNGSGLAVGRTLLAVLEVHQGADSSVSVPEALQPYMGGLQKIARDAG
ncbi:MAG: serine--tRNA ligase [Rhodospirillales bacterium]|jgi:seryl-tRNA synthetase|nr:serine--tRNA ligase [Rhodospirillales bacterium]MDP6805937.1 serine--tRNA ligase [Rhodospirillales bacterium]